MDLNPKLILLLLAALGLAGISLRRYLHTRQFIRRHNCQPVTRTFNKDPFLGLDILSGTIRAIKDHQVLQRGAALHHIHGNTLKAKELTSTIILTIEPENIKTILSLNFTDYSLGHRLEPFRPLLGEGIFNTDGAHWAESRALIRPSFARDQIADLTLLEALSIGTLKKSQGELGFADAFQYSQQAILTRSLLGPLNAVYRDRKAEECDRVCREFVQEFVEEAVRAAESRSEKEKETGSETKHKRIFSHELASRTSAKERIRNELLNVLLAGRDTTASLLANLFFVLAKNPAIWEKLRDEVAVLQNRPPTYDELRGLKYVEYCVNESLRLHPVVPRNGRKAIRDTVLPLGGGDDGLSPAFVPKGTVVAYYTYAMHRRTDIYGPDAEEFRPERWADGALRPRWGYLPFNGGPRICIGQRYALTEASYVLGRMVQEFRELESRDPGPWEENLSLTVCSRNGARVGLVR
ncbi:cytochrome P450 [Aspergillus ellipticus CBS 707.79]|uniref:Cytochrome P450 n=1 Tax=Aspergillus ellipticus CBS 707.79 TaxID=1448320 RepID=A0A319DR62_9EURO|nr:cytochrome P450 [Aspergillus ellipticus CBS 707.79]